MKKILMLSACAVLAFVATAQVQIQVPNLEKLRKNVAKSDADTANPKKKENPKTWMRRAEMLMDVYEESTMGIAQEMHKAIFTTLTKETKTDTLEGVGYEVLVFPNIDLYFDQKDLLTLWIEKETATSLPLSQAYSAYLKAIELDVKGAQAKKIREGLTALAGKLRVEGVNAYTKNDYNEAQLYFIEAVEALSNPLIGKIDTIIAYYAGVVSLNERIHSYDTAIHYLRICLDNSYFEDGNVYSNLARAYRSKGDSSTMQEQLLTEGFAKFPSNQSILIELINIYLESGKEVIKVIPYLKHAQENEPTNATLYFAEAALYEKLKMLDDAERMYLKTIEVDSSNYNAYYNIGALYYNKGVEYIKEAGEIKDWRSPKIKELDALANDEFKRSLVPFTKAHELQPDDKYALETVKNIYFRFREESKEMMDKYNEYNDKYTKLQQ